MVVDAEEEVGIDWEKVGIGVGGGDWWDEVGIKGRGWDSD